MKKIILRFLLLTLFCSLAYGQDATDKMKTSTNNSPTVGYKSIKALQNNKQFKEARSAAVEYLKKYPNDVDVMLLLAQMDYQDKSYTDTQKLTQQILKIKPNYTDARTLQIRSEIALLDYTVALKDLRTGLKVAPNDKELLKILAGMRGAMTEYLQKYPNDTDVMLLLAQLDYKDKKYTTVIQLTQQILKKQPNNSDAELLLNKSKMATKVRMPTKKRNYQARQVIEADDGYISEQLKNGNVEQVKQLAENYQLSNERINFQLAKYYIKQNDYDSAIRTYETIIHNNPSNLDARLKLIDLEFEHKEFSAATDNVEQGLEYNPTSLDLLYRNALTYFYNGRFYQAAYYNKQILQNNAQYKPALGLLSDLNDINPKYNIGLNAIGITTFQQHVSDLGKNWNYSSIYYTRDTIYGRIFATLNYDARNGDHSTQKVLEVLPVINKYIYLDLVAAYASNLNLFPRYLLGAEAYFSIPDAVGLSVGDRYSDIDRTYFNAYTGSITKSWGSYAVIFRPYYFIPKGDSPQSVLYTGSVTRYFGTTDTAISLNFGAGTSPDLADLQSVTFFTINDKYINLQFLYPLFHHRIELNAGINYERQAFPSALVRELSGVNLGLEWRF